MPAFVYWTALRRIHDQIAELAPLLLRQRGRRRFFQQLLMPALNRTLALAEMHDAAMVIAQHLDLDVARVLEILLDVHVRHAECRLGFALRRLDRVPELLRRAHDAHAAAAAARCRFDDDRKAACIGELQRRFFALDRTVGARQQRQAGFLHRAPRARLVAHQANDFGIGADEPDVAGLADFREIGRFREKSVTGMDRVGAGDLRGADDRRHVQVALGAARRSDAHVFVGKPHVQRVLVRLRIHRDGFDAQLAARDDDAHRDLAAVRDQDFFKHWVLWRTAARRTARAGRSRRRP